MPSAVLGSILLDNGMLNQAAEKHKHEDFFLESHRRIFDQMLKLFERGHSDPITLVDGLRQAGDLEAVGGVAYVSQLFHRYSAIRVSSPLRANY